MDTFEGLEPNAQPLFSLRQTKTEYICINKEETVIQFFSNFIKFTELKKFICFPESYISEIIPRIKILDVLIGGKNANEFIENALLQIFVIATLAVFVSEFFYIGLIIPFITLALACRI